MLCQEISRASGMRQWAISIGINQYQFFQPLSYAQHDAQAIQRFLVEDAGVPAEQCLLLTEASPPQWGKATYPDRETIQSWLDLLIQQCLEPGDVLWCFFSGYGVCQQGQDYLVPIEGNPMAIAATAIPLEAMFRRLRQVTNATVLVLLDINRNESSSSETVGNHTTHLASITGVPTILSCQPGQFSRETSALGHGFFTAALLESLRDRHCTTLAAVEQYLSDRLPELSEHYWRPIQQAVMLCPDEKRQQTILPLAPWVTDAAAYGDRNATARTAQQNGFTPTTNGAATVVTAPTKSTPYIPYSTFTSDYGLQQPAATNGSVDVRERAIATVGTHTDAASYAGSNGSTNGYTPLVNVRSGYSQANGSPPVNGIRTEPLDSAAQNHENRVAPSVPVTAVSQPHSDQPEDANEIPDALFWRPVLLWGGFAVVALVLGVLLRNCAAFTPKAPATAQQGTTAVRPSPSGTGQPGVAPLAAPAAPSPAAVTKTFPPQSIASAQAGVSGANRLDPAVTRQAQVRPTQATSVATIALASARSPLARAKALVPVNSNQASPYWYAIQEAETIKPGQPDYAQAKQDMALWSRQIMSIARQRGRQGNFDAAIVAVRLIPQDQPVYSEAKSALSRWCPSLKRQQNVNPVQRQQAKAVCQNVIS